jgi:TusA-related sulfurtransferase
MKEIDCLGDMCPIPIIKLKTEFENGADEILLVTDHGCVVESLKDFIPHMQLYYEIEEIIPGIWEIIVTREKRKS